MPQREPLKKTKQNKKTPDQGNYQHFETTNRLHEQRQVKSKDKNEAPCPVTLLIFTMRLLSRNVKGLNEQAE